jgi:hypothetical protein
MKQKTVPYNTGKVLIGLCYIPPIKDNGVSKDMYRLQTALLKSNEDGLFKRFVSMMDSTSDQYLTGSDDERR